MSQHGFANINTEAGDLRENDVLQGMVAQAGTLLDLDISAGAVGDLEVVADTALAVTAGDSADFSGYLVSVDAAGVLEVTQSANTDHATEALAMVEAALILVPAGSVAVFHGANDDTTAVAGAKEFNRRGERAFSAIAADETITL